MLRRDQECALENSWSLGGNTRPEFSTLFGHGSSDDGALHFALVGDHYSGIVLKVNKGPVQSSPRLPLSDDHGL